MLWEVVANALDDHLAGHATRIEVTCNEDGSVTVEDDGAGFPIHLVEGLPFAQRALTSLHATGTLDGHAPHVHVGRHGVGICVVNALSSLLVLDVFREGRHYRQRYVAGEPQADLQDIEPAERTGTRVTFVPDPTIFANTEVSFDILDKRLREIALLNAGLRIELRDDRRRRRSHEYPEGLRGFLAEADDVLTCSGVAEGIRVDVALSYSRTALWPRLQSFANTEPTTEHGSHVDGLLLGISDAVAPQLPARNSASPRDAMAHNLEAVVNVNGSLRWLSAVVNVNIACPTFASPTKERLSSPEVTEAVRTVVSGQLAAQLASRPELRDVLLRRLDEVAPSA